MKKTLILFIISLIICLPSYADKVDITEQIVAFYNDNNIQEAMRLLQLIPESDRTAQDWLLLGNILQDNSKDSEAVFMYKRAILTDSNFYKPYYNLANIQFNEGKYSLALENYKKAVKINSEFSYGYYNMGCTYLKLKEFKKAKSCFQKAINIKNTVPEFHYNLAYCYKILQNNKQAQNSLNIYNKLQSNF